MISFKSRGEYTKTIGFLSRLRLNKFTATLDRYGAEGVAALSMATPTDTGFTADSWYYEISESHGRYRITWLNSHVIDGVPIAIILQVGHGTNLGGYVYGHDYINPAIKPIFDRLVIDTWKAVTGA